MLKCDIQYGVAELRLDRPLKRNALNSALIVELRQALDKCETIDEVGAIVIAGSGPGFCGGSDLGELVDVSADEARAHEEFTGSVCRQILNFRKPVIAAVEGFAIGGGFLLALAADIVISTRTATWHLPEVSLGWLPPWGLASLIRRVGCVHARQIVWGLEAFDGAEALRLGVVDVLVEPNEARPRATRIAAALAALPSHAVVAAKELMRNPSIAGDSQFLDNVSAKIFSDNYRSKAAQLSLSKFSSRHRGSHG